MIRGAALLGLALVACADLAPIEEGACGNAVLDPGEDCDPPPGLVGSDGPRCERCQYACDATASCPLGWGCGANGICSRPSSDLANGQALSGWLPLSLSAVDLNGDGVVDLAGAFGDHVEFRLGTGAARFDAPILASSFIARGEISTAWLDSDARGDVVLPTEQGLLVWRGQAAGAPQQVAYASYSAGGSPAVRMFPVRYPPSPDAAVLVALFPSDDGELAACIATPEGPRGIRTVMSDHGFYEIGDRLAVVDLDGDGHDEIVLPFEGAAAIKVLGVRPDPVDNELIVAGPRYAGSVQEIAIGSARSCQLCAARVSDLRIHRGAHVTDVDGDGARDLLVSVVGDDVIREAVAVVRGRGDGSFDEPYLEERFAALAAASTVAPGVERDLSVWPIAIGDLDADGDADYVGANGVFLSERSGLTQIVRRDAALPLRWTHAVVGDLDGDGDPDVAAIHAGERRVDTLRCDGASCSRRPPYFAESGVADLRVASFTPSAARDLVLLERSGAGVSAQDTLSVMYGRPDDWPLEPRAQARFHRLEGLDVGQVAGIAGSAVDSYEDVTVAARTRADEVALGVLYATGTRELVSPFLARSGVGIAQRALRGRFSGAAFDDLVLLGSPPGLGPQAWWVAASEDAAFSPIESGVDLRRALGDDGLDLDCARAAAGDLQGDGRDEIVLVLGRAVCDSASVTRVAVGSVEDGELTFAISDLQIPEGPGGVAITVTDLGGDGAAELLIARQGSLWQAHAKSSGFAAPTQLAALPEGETVLGLVPVSLVGDARSPSRAAVLTAGHVVVMSADGPPSTVPSRGARGLVSADLDGDGLGDLLLLGELGVEPLHTRPAAPLGGRP